MCAWNLQPRASSSAESHWPGGFVAVKMLSETGSLTCSNEFTHKVEYVQIKDLK